MPQSGASNKYPEDAGKENDSAETEEILTYPISKVLQVNALIQILFIPGTFLDIYQQPVKKGLLS